MKSNYPKAYKEVLEVLKYVPENDVKKIPQSLIDTFTENMDTSYVFTIDISKDFEEQILLEETKAILANIFKDYWATPARRREIEIKERNEIKKLEEEKRLKYNPDNLFKDTQNNQSEFTKNDSNISSTIEGENSNLPIEVKKENFFKKLFNYIKKFITRK